MSLAGEAQRAFPESFLIQVGVGFSPPPSSIQPDQAEAFSHAMRDDRTIKKMPSDCFIQELKTRPSPPCLSEGPVGRSMRTIKRIDMQYDEIR